jgi:hypothetical protein
MYIADGMLMCCSDCAVELRWCFRVSKENGYRRRGFALMEVFWKCMSIE